MGSPHGKARRSRLRALRDLLLGARAEPEGTLSDDDPTTAGPPRSAPSDATLPARIGPYPVLRKLGQGGMGVVYAARDEKLGRTVAIKTISGGGADDTAVKRFWREARAAASVNHPNVCQLYEIDEWDGGLYLAMELLEGESLGERLKRGALPVGEALTLALGILGALEALHARDVVHRDLKPTNVFLTAHGVKLLDFGLARPSARLETLSGNFDPESALTQPGMLVGTPRYMAPEQVQGREVDFRADLFALGAILFEMLAGRPAFAGTTMVEVLYATLHEQPPALSGSPAVVAADRVIRRALAKSPDQRPKSAAAMAAELRPIPLSGSGETAVPAQALTRLVVLPFRILRPDPDTDFLTFSLADAISTSLAGLGSVMVRSSAAAARFAKEAPDLKAIAAEADVDLVLMGTLLRSGDQLRATAQLVEAPAGTLVGSHTVQSPVGDVFRLEDDLTRRIVESLALPLAGRGAPGRRDVPASARAYEFYLRANEIARDYTQLPVARDLLLRCVEEDPGFAPAWARLGRAHRVIGKYWEDPAGNRSRAEAAFRRALELNPDLSLAHKLYTHFEAETGRAREAMVRLLGHAQKNRNDAELFAGLVHACRYCGLVEASMAAHDEARRLDPHVPTSRDYTLLLALDYERLVREPEESAIDAGPRVLALHWMGRTDEARAFMRRVGLDTLPAGFRLVLEAIFAYVEGNREEALAGFDRAIPLHDDPEAFFMWSTVLARLDQPERTLDLLGRVADGGYAALPSLERDPAWNGLRANPRFQEFLAKARERRALAQAAYREAGGERLLGV